MKTLFALAIGTVLATGSALAGDEGHKHWRSYYVNDLNTKSVAQNGRFTAAHVAPKPATRTVTPAKARRR